MHKEYNIHSIFVNEDEFKKKRKKKKEEQQQAQQKGATPVFAL